MELIHYGTAVIDGDAFKSFGIHPITASLYGYSPADIVEVKMVVAEDQTVPAPNSHQTDPSPDYWGWMNADSDKFTLVYPKYFLLDMCFPSGIKAAQATGRGHAYRLIVTKKELN